MAKRILVIEDQEDNRQILRDLLANAGYDMIEAEDGEQGVAAGVGGEQHHLTPERGGTGCQHEGVMCPVVRTRQQQDTQRFRRHRPEPPPGAATGP